jgi:hypothetical protein
MRSVQADEFEELAQACLARADAASDLDEEARWLATALEWLRLAAAARDRNEPPA